MTVGENLAMALARAVESGLWPRKPVADPERRTVFQLVQLIGAPIKSGVPRG